LSSVILTFGKTADAALLNNSLASSQVTTSFEANSLDVNDIELISFTINEVLNWSAPVPFLLGYEVLRTSSITLNNTDDVAKVLSSLIVPNGANKIGNILFNPTSSELLIAYQSMLTVASANCIDNAQRMVLPLTASFGQILGPAITMQETSSQQQQQKQQPMYARMEAFASPISSDQLFSPGQTTVRASVSCVFLLSRPTALPPPRSGNSRRV